MAHGWRSGKRVRERERGGEGLGRESERGEAGKRERAKERWFRKRGGQRWTEAEGRWVREEWKVALGWVRVSRGRVPRTLVALEGDQLDEEGESRGSRGKRRRKNRRR